jgi:hypothetical protein
LAATTLLGFPAAHWLHRTGAAALNFDDPGFFQITPVYPPTSYFFWVSSTRTTKFETMWRLPP